MDAIVVEIGGVESVFGAFEAVLDDFLALKGTFDADDVAITGELFVDEEDEDDSADTVFTDCADK